MRSLGLEAPFVGRDRELRLVKELFHGSADEKKAQLVSVTGIAGIGKSRLSWEFEKYIDGLAETCCWHRGRCLSYGEGVAYWALAEMVRMRCRHRRGRGARRPRARSSARPSSSTSPTPRSGAGSSRASRTCSDSRRAPPATRRTSSRPGASSSSGSPSSTPTILVFEDMQWADAGLLDFLEYLLEWSRKPSAVRARARPARARRQAPVAGAPASAASRRCTSSRCPPRRWTSCSRASCPACPTTCATQILERAEGVPLYAVETVRMLLDRGLLVQEGNVYRPTGPVETLEVPETLHALIAARLDGLTQEERRLVQDGAVLGKTFTKQGLAAAHRAPGRGARAAARRARPQGDPLDPGRPALARARPVRVPAGHRQARRLRDALEEGAQGEAPRGRRVPRVAPGAPRRTRSSRSSRRTTSTPTTPARDDPDAEEIRATAREMLVRAGERAASLGGERRGAARVRAAVELTDDPLAQAELHERAGMMARIGARVGRGRRALRAGDRAVRGGRATHPAARVSAALAEIMWDRGRLEQGLESMERAFEVLSHEEPDEDLAALAAQLGRFLFFAGERLGARAVETALDLAEALRLPEVLSQALNTKASSSPRVGVVEEALGAPPVRARGRARARQALRRSARVLQPCRRPVRRRPLRGGRGLRAGRPRARPPGREPLLGDVLPRRAIRLRSRRLGRGR